MAVRNFYCFVQGFFLLLLLLFLFFFEFFFFFPLSPLSYFFSNFFLFPLSNSTVQFFHGNNPLTEELYSPLSKTGNWTGNEKEIAIINTNISLSSFPLESVVCLTLFATKEVKKGAPLLMKFSFLLFSFLLFFFVFSLSSFPLSLPLPLPLSLLYLFFLWKGLSNFKS